MYKPYQIVAAPTGDVELMSYPSEGKVFARLVVGDPTSAEYINVAELGVVLAESETTMHQYYYLRADHARRVRELLSLTGVDGEIIEAMRPQTICGCGKPTQDFSRACSLDHVHYWSH